MKYEIEPVYWLNYPHLSEIATITGLEFQEIKAVTDTFGTRWNGKTYIDIFNKLGFNTSKFIKFDPDTIYPCIIRLTRKDDKYWYPFVYYNELVYQKDQIHSFKNVSKCMNGKYFMELEYKPYKITSMLQVWI